MGRPCPRVTLGVIGHIAVFVETVKADFNDIYKVPAEAGAEA